MNFDYRDMFSMKIEPKVNFQRFSAKDIVLNLCTLERVAYLTLRLPTWVLHSERLWRLPTWVLPGEATNWGSLIDIENKH